LLFRRYAMMMAIITVFATLRYFSLRYLQAMLMDISRAVSLLFADADI